MLRYLALYQINNLDMLIPKVSRQYRRQTSLGSKWPSCLPKYLWFTFPYKAILTFLWANMLPQGGDSMPSPQGLSVQKSQENQENIFFKDVHFLDLDCQKGIPVPQSLASKKRDARCQVLLSTQCRGGEPGYCACQLKYIMVSKHALEIENNHPKHSEF